MAMCYLILELLMPIEYNGKLARQEEDRQILWLESVAMMIVEIAYA